MTGPVDDTFTVTDAEVRAARPVDRAARDTRAVRDREVTFLVGLALLSVGCGIAWLPLAFAVPGAIITAVALWARAGA